MGKHSALKLKKMTTLGKYSALKLKKMTEF